MCQQMAMVKPTVQALFVHKLTPDEAYLTLDKLAIKYADQAKGHD